MANSTATKLPCSQLGCSYSPQLVLHGNGASCCDSSQQIQDGLPGQSVCPCQLDRVLQHRITSMPVNVLPRPPFGDAGAFTIGSGSGLSAFYSPLSRTCDFKDMAQPWRDSWYLSQASRNPFEFHGFDPHTHASCTRFAERFSPIDLAAAGARRKNATRETTSTLKAWLYEHRKNPYPTKGEKIMLAILTKMTLTQVSTWFANARRRLKKENKMTWSPRNRCGERKDGGESSDVEDIDLDINSDDEKPSADSHSHCKLQENESNDIKKENTAEKNEVNNDEKSYRDFTNVGSDNCENSCLGVDETTTVAPAPARRAVPTLITKRELEVSGSVEDSPVKSLRKWVDGCFYSPVMSSCPVPQPSSPVQNQQTTPPPTTHRTSTETPVITSAPSSNSYRQEEREGSEAEEKSPNSVVRDDTLRHEEEEKSSSNTAINPTEKRTNEMKNYREFDAALALTTLSSR